MKNIILTIAISLSVLASKAQLSITKVTFPVSAALWPIQSGSKVSVLRYYTNQGYKLDQKTPVIVIKGVKNYVLVKSN